MSQTETVKTELEARFPFLAGAIRVQRERRLWIEVAQDRFLEVFEHLVKGSQFSNLCTITGLDLGAELGFIYHLARDGGMMANVKTRALKGRAIRTVTHLFEGAAIYERELEDLLGAKVEGLPSGPRYPLPDDWPTDEHPLLKDWKAKGEAAEAAAPASPAAATPATPAAADAQEGAPRE
ncbi:MAG TPA: NADH-quinone oxidoreductase subunit C [Spirochaetia bacterium]|nr:NADH-quinone oxidoreductase subunit C [Spirochaetia bacterium]